MAPLRGCRGDDLPNFLLRQVFPAAIVGVGAAPGNFPFYDGWGSRDGTLASPLFLQGEAPDFPLLIYYMESFRPCAPSTKILLSYRRPRERPCTACRTSTTFSAQSTST